MSTIKDIADLAGVSTATVSRILNTDTDLKVSPETRQKVFDAAAQLNYQKNIKKTSDNVGTIAITSWYKKEFNLPSLYLRAIRWGVETTLKNAGFRITRSFFNEEEPNVEGADGIIAIGQFDDKSLLSLKSLNKPLVVLNQDTLNHGISCVSTDYVHPVKEIITYFRESGHTKIGMIEGHSETDPSVDPRSLAFRQELLSQSNLDEKLIFKGDFSIESGYTAMKEAIDTLGEQLPSAFFVCSDTMAFGALRALSEAKIAVPDRVSLIGFGNNEMGAFTTPSLSTVELATHQIGSIGALTLLNHLSGLQTEPVHTVTQAQLRFRESALPLPLDKE